MTAQAARVQGGAPAEHAWVQDGPPRKSCQMNQSGVGVREGIVRAVHARGGGRPRPSRPGRRPRGRARQHRAGRARRSTGQSAAPAPGTRSGRAPAAHQPPRCRCCSSGSSPAPGCSLPTRSPPAGRRCFAAGAPQQPRPQASRMLGTAVCPAAQPPAASPHAALANPIHSLNIRLSGRAERPAGDAPNAGGWKDRRQRKSISAPAPNRVTRG